MKKFLGIILVLALVCSLCACDSSDYKKASDALAAGDYEAALAGFEALADYKDSADKVSECRYQLALAEFDGGSYEKALDAFNALGGFSDSADKAKECRYRLALEELDGGSYEKAIAGFEALGDYADAAQRVKEATLALTKEKVVGKWVSDEIDITDQLRAALLQSELGGVFSDIQLEKVAFRAQIELTERGTYVSAVVKDEFAETIKSFMSSITEATTKYILSIYEENLELNGYTMQDLYDELGTDDPDEVVRQLEGASVAEMFEEMQLEAVLETFAGVGMTGEYELTESELLLRAGEITEHAVYKLDRDEITIRHMEVNGTTSIDGYPQTYTRIG